jgi:hypothetical protein
MNREDDSKWPPKNKDGRQELEIRLGNDHISFEVCDKAPLLRALDTDDGLDRQDRSPRGCHRICRSGRPTSVLLPGARFESTGVQSHRAALQDQADLNEPFCQEWLFASGPSVSRKSTRPFTVLLSSFYLALHVKREATADWVGCPAYICSERFHIIGSCKIETVARHLRIAPCTVA